MAPPTLSYFAFFLFLAMVSSPTPSSAARCHPDDKKALIQIQSDLGHPYDLISWNTPGAGGCCDWPGVACDVNNRVQDLYLDNIDTPFTIPASLTGLHFLTTLEFHKNPNLTGPIPPVIGQLTNLTFLRLDWNALSGPIPHFLAKLTSLTYLNLAFNQFSGSIPPFLAGLPLTFIRLDRNRLTGSIPDALAKTSSTYLYLSHNNLTGPLPASFAETSIQVIDFSRNKLSGDASLLLGASKPLQNLDLSRNLFEFDLTNVVFPENLTTLDINHNKIYGSIPSQITKLDGLYILNVTYNRLCGQIPTGGQLGRFDQYSYIHNKCLCGSPLPACKYRLSIVSSLPSVFSLFK